MDINNPTIYSLSPNIMYTLIDGEAVILGKDNQLFATNVVATNILQFIEAQPETISMICAYLVQNFDVDETTCMIEVEELINQFIEKKIVIAS